MSQSIPFQSKSNPIHSSERSIDRRKDTHNKLAWQSIDCLWVVVDKLQASTPTARSCGWLLAFELLAVTGLTSCGGRRRRKSLKG